jgi:hypothetical protein
MKTPYKSKSAIAKINNAGTLDTAYIPERSDGKIIGISVGKTKSAETMGHYLVSIEQGKEKPLVKVPASQLLPEGERHFYPVNLQDTGNITITTEKASGADGIVITDGTAVIIIFHFENPETPEKTA